MLKNIGSFKYGCVAGWWAVSVYAAISPLAFPFPSNIMIVVVVFVDC